ncbi:MAG: hypothetical protein HYV03_06005, partial [Deltaproteobacteria bacterium]|nr:hypothetical protein [Deltaproteobacteria bacterium]
MFWRREKSAWDERALEWLAPSPWWRRLLAVMQRGGHIVAAVVNGLLLSIVYFLAVGPTGFVRRTGTQQLLVLRPEPKAKSYWEDLSLVPEPVERYL